VVVPVPARKIVTPPAAIDFSAIRQELQIPAQYPPDAVAEAAEVVSQVIPAAAPLGDDATDIPFVTVDPPGSLDLDQAVHLDRSGDGYLVRYAIADVASFVAPDGLLAQETWRPGRDAVQPGRQHAVASDRTVRGRGQPAARNGTPGGALDDPAGRRR
jgi:hypothetical protein